MGLDPSRLVTMPPTEPANDLARTVDLLWGRTPPPRGTRGPRPRLSVEKIVTAAVTVADAEGLAALSMQRIAAEVGYTTMSLYNYVPNKETLIELMLDAVMPPPPAPGDDWREDLRAWSRATWDVFLGHRWMIKAGSSNPPLGPLQLRWFEAGLAVLARGGLRGGEIMSTAVFLLSAIRGQAALAADMGDGTDGADVARVMGAVVSEDLFPTLFAVVNEPSPDDGSHGLELGFGLERLLDGVEEFVRPRA